MNKVNNIIRPIITIIIPFYETINYVEETLTSIADQTCDQSAIEVLVVNDGNVYDIQNIIKKYQVKIPNLQYFVKQNGNWSSVINYVKHNKLAHGKYVTVLDSDDKYDKKICGRVTELDIKKQYDLIIANYYFWKPSTNRKWTLFPVFQFHNKTMKEKRLLLSPSSLPIAKFYHTNIFYQLPDLKEHSYFQDVIMYNEAIKLIKIAYYIRKPLAFHRIDRQDNSTNQTWSDKKLETWIQVLDYLQTNDATLICITYTMIKGFNEAYYKKYNAHYEIKTKVNWAFLPHVYYWIFYVWIKLFYAKNLQFKKIK